MPIQFGVIMYAILSISLKSFLRIIVMCITRLYVWPVLPHIYVWIMSKPAQDRTVQSL